MSQLNQALYVPSAWGSLYHSLPHDEALGAGSAGPGKTVVLTHEPFAQIFTEHQRLSLPKTHEYYLDRGMSTGWALYLRRTTPMLEQVRTKLIREFKLVDPGVDFNESKNTFTFTSGFKYQLGHCKDPNDWEQYYSNEYTIIMFDELVQFEEEQYDQIRTRLRSSDPVLRTMLKVRSMSNPVVTREGMDNVRLNNPFWVRDRFVAPCPEGKKTLEERVRLSDGEERSLTRIYLPARLSDNPNKDFVRDYETRLRGMKPHIQKALLDGDWFVTAGSFYGESWERDIHVVRPFRIPKDWLRFRSMDWGFKAKGVIGWWAMDLEGNIYCEREIVFKGKTATQMAVRVREVERDLGLWKDGRSLITGPADTQLWEQRGDSVKSKADEFMEAGVPWTQADKRSRKRNAELFVGRLDDHADHTQPPGIMFFESCRECITTIPSIPSEAGDPEVPMDGGPDHAHDMVLYACAFASHGRAGIPAIRNEDDDEPEATPEKRGALGYGEQY